jgi:hypothetical protein
VPGKQVRRFSDTTAQLYPAAHTTATAVVACTAVCHLSTSLAPVLLLIQNRNSGLKGRHVLSSSSSCGSSASVQMQQQAPPSVLQLKVSLLQGCSTLQSTQKMPQPDTRAGHQSVPQRCLQARRGLLCLIRLMSVQLQNSRLPKPTSSSTPSHINSTNSSTSSSLCKGCRVQPTAPSAPPRYALSTHPASAAPGTLQALPQQQQGVRAGAHIPQAASAAAAGQIPAAAASEAAAVQVSVLLVSHARAPVAFLLTPQQLQPCCSSSSSSTYTSTTDMQG